jgi:hypothetical protein
MSLRAIRGLVEREFPALVTDTEIIDNKIRVFLVDGSYIDFWWSTQIPGRYSYHWERRHIDGTVYRHDNMPHARWTHIKTFPKHFHNGSDDKANESRINDDPVAAVKEFLEFVNGKLGK